MIYRRNPNSEVIDSLQALLADTYILYIKTQNFHWNVEGSDFGPLHTLFGDQYAELALAIDLIAERIRALGGHAAGSCSEFSELSHLDESSGLSTRLSQEKMVQILAEDNKKVSEECERFSQMIGDKDEGTKTLVADRALAHSKAAWMLKSILQG